MFSRSWKARAERRERGGRKEGKGKGVVERGMGDVRWNRGTV